MTRQEIKSRAKEQLGNNIFGPVWLYAVLTLLIVNIVTAIVTALSSTTSYASLISLLITGPINYALAYMFLKLSHDGQQMNFGDLFKGFKDDFGQTFLLGLLNSIFVTLWTLLFIIPGIIKTYSYAMIYYIKVDHPEYDWKACFNESKRIMNGHKMDLFVLHLSFIGWMIVGAICFGVGTLWVSAYMQAATANFYESIKDEPIVVEI